ncbi:unnamed protein product [Taenia asiatica]|uniref:SCP domain-containing protein n=1 Tax=Taenia asiatica TaxID=60517 RepID=A0A0R3W3P1_TAEAS|nr:unnamed protein product [Taenia asiatica]
MKVNLAFNEEGIKAHNFLRRLHGCAPLVVALALAESAQSYAEVLVRGTSFQHSQITDVGENLAKLSDSLPMKDLSAAQVTLSWYNEIKNYHFVDEDPICCGHFSQLIWQSTTAMGMGIAESADRRTVIVVAHYQPQGNRIGQWSANVPRLLHGTPHTFTLEELTDFTLTLPIETNREKSTGNVSKETVNFAPLNARQIDESGAFAMEVFMVLNQRRIALGLPPFLLNENDPPDTHIHLNLTVADPNCKYVTIGCEFNPPFKRSSVVLLFA